ncbi:peptidase inhibitor family I36 protein [Streptomyces sp. NPDC058464]|uniref:peptidase inhibitor family I36 protein n=1 Tax=Streptomyces sp. NPDC058464 TaxID=3346511 RepID=UPI003667688B
MTGQGLDACPEQSVCLYQDTDFNAGKNARIWVATGDVERLSTCDANDRASSLYIDARDSWKVKLFKDAQYEGGSSSPTVPGLPAASSARCPAGGTTTSAPSASSSRRALAAGQEPAVATSRATALGGDVWPFRLRSHGIAPVQNTASSPVKDSRGAEKCDAAPGRRNLIGGRFRCPPLGRFGRLTSLNSTKHS